MSGLWLMVQLWGCRVSAWLGELPPAEPGHSELHAGRHCRMAGSQVSWAAFGTEVGLHPQARGVSLLSTKHSG